MNVRDAAVVLLLLAVAAAGLVLLFTLVPFAPPPRLG